jgi:hypothetical protein
LLVAKNADRYVSAHFLHQTAFFLNNNKGGKSYTKIPNSEGNPKILNSNSQV